MKTKKNLFIWLFIFVFLSTYSLNSTQKKKISIFSIENINIDGIINVNETNFKNRINKFFGESLFFFNSKELKKIASEFNFIKEIKIKKIYPNKIKVEIKEFNPLAVLMDNNEKIVKRTKAQTIARTKFLKRKLSLPTKDTIVTWRICFKAIDAPKNVIQTSP